MLVWSVCIVTVGLVIVCSNQRARLEKYVVLLCRSPNRYLYSADGFSQRAILYIYKKKDVNIVTTVNSVEELVSSFGAE